MPDGAISFPIFGNGYINPPSYFQIGPVTVHWYGVIIAMGFLLAVIYCARRAKDFGIGADNVYDLVIFGLPLGIIGARIYYIIFYPEMFRDADFIDYIAIWNGGLAIYGGVIAGVITVIVYSKIKKIKPMAFLDLLGLGLLIGQCVGRWGNFMNREAYGAETDLPWRMGLTYGGSTVYVHPTFLYESLWNFAGFLLIHFLSKKRKYDGEPFLMYVAWYGLGRAFIEGLRADSLYIPGTAIRVSQLLAAVSCAAALIALVLNRTVFRHDEKDLFCNRVSVSDENAPEAAGDTDEQN